MIVVAPIAQLENDSCNVLMDGGDKKDQDVGAAVLVSVQTKNLTLNNWVLKIDNQVIILVTFKVTG